MARKCPECGERLSLDASRCACGWSQGGNGKPPSHDMQCAWTYGDLRCRYPVGLFADGAKSGFCIFHRANKQGAIAADLARDSENYKPEDYQRLAALQTYNGGNPMVDRLREAIRLPAKTERTFVDKWLENFKARAI